MNVSLTPEQCEYVRRKVQQDFGNASEYFRDLIRERMKREIEADLEFLKATTRGATAGPNEEELERIVAVQRQVRKTLKREGRI